MKKIGEYWLPNVDVRGFKRIRKAKANYENGGHGRQISHLTTALDRVGDSFGSPLSSWAAIDAGANVGAYARNMARVFAHVHAFEPAPDTFDCLQRNIQEWGLGDKISVYPNALSENFENVKIGASWGRRSVSRKVQGAGNISAIPIDSLELQNVLFFKIDVEGYENKVIEGASKLLEVSKPFIMMEVKEYKERKSKNPFQAHQALLSRGYHLICKIGDREIDWLYAPASRS